MQISLSNLHDAILIHGPAFRSMQIHPHPSNGCILYREVEHSTTRFLHFPSSVTAFLPHTTPVLHYSKRTLNPHFLRAVKKKVI